MGRSRNEMFEDIIRSLGGRVAEALMMDDISTGASSDIQHATRVARNMVKRYGMSEALGPVLYGSEHSSDAVFLGRDFSSGQDYSEQTAALIDTEIHRLITEAQDKCRQILIEHKDKLEFVAQFLLKHETMDGDQFEAAMQSDEPDEEQLLAIAEEKKRRSREANEQKRRRDEQQATQAAQAEADSEGRGTDEPMQQSSSPRDGDEGPIMKD